MCALNPLPIKSLLQLPHFSINPISSYSVIPCPINNHCRISCSWLDTTPLPFCTTCGTGSIALIPLCSMILGTRWVDNAVMFVVNEGYTNDKVPTRIPITWRLPTNWTNGSISDEVARSSESWFGMATVPLKVWGYLCITFICHKPAVRKHGE